VTDPITNPTYRFLEKGIPNLDGLPVYDSPFTLEEPYLRATNVDWQPDQTGSRAYLGYEEALPEMGEELDRSVGDVLTVLVLCYGNFPNLHRRCIDSILRTIPVYRLDLRIALNCVGPGTQEYVSTVAATKVYNYTDNKHKYPIMRDMLYDTETPLLGKYVAWFDDNSYTVNLDWVNNAVRTIKKQPDFVGMYGIRRYRPVTKAAEKRWLANRSWNKGVELSNIDGVADGVGDKVLHFCDDWFWVASKKALYAADIPCRDLVQRGGGPIIGEQLRQAGYKIKQFNAGKTNVYMPPFKKQIRRGDPGKFPWEMNTE